MAALLDDDHLVAAAVVVAPAVMVAVVVMTALDDDLLDGLGLRRRDGRNESNAENRGESEGERLHGVPPVGSIPCPLMRGAPPSFQPLGAIGIIGAADE